MRLPFPLSGVGAPPPGVERNGAGEAGPHPLQRFHQALGNLAFTRHDTLWYGVGRFSLATVPNNQRVAATKREIQQLLVDCGKLVAVFCPRAGSGPVVKEYMLHEKDYDLGRLQEQFRKHVRKHARRFIARELTWDEMARGVAAVHADVASRRGGAAPELTDLRRWTEACQAAAGTAGLTAYGCLIDDSVAGYVVAWREMDVCHGVLLHRNSRHDARRTGNVLLYAFSKEQIGRADTSTINLGRSWYPPKPGLDSFKRHAGYEERETVLAIVLHPRVESVLRASWVQRCLRQIGAVSGGWLNFESDLQLFEAALLTDIP